MKTFQTAEDVGSHCSTPSSSCPATPPRPRLPKYFKPTPFLPRDSPPPVLPRHLDSNLIKSHDEEVPLAPLRQRTFLSDFSQDSDENSHRFRPVIPSPKLLRHTFLRDSSSDSFEHPSVCSPTVKSPKYSKKTFNADVCQGFEKNSKSLPVAESIRLLRTAFFQDLSGSRDKGSGYSENVSSFKSEYGKVDKAKVPPPVSPKPSRKKVVGSLPNNVRTSTSAIGEHVKDRKTGTLSHTASGTILKSEKEEMHNEHLDRLLKPVSKEVSKEFKSKKDVDKKVPPAVEHSPKLFGRKMNQKVLSGFKDNTIKSRSVPASPKLTVRQFWRDYSPSSEEGGSDTGVLSSRSKHTSKTKRSKGLSLFRKMRNKLLDVGIPGIQNGVSMYTC